MGPFEDWRGKPAPRFGLPEWVLARRVSPEREDASALAARLGRASKAADAVSHHLVLPALGMLETPDGDVVQLSAWVDGAPLERCSGPLTVRAAVWIARQLLEALAHAHALGFTHRNLNPEAVWVDRSGEVTLDFGLASDDSDDDDWLTASLDFRFTHPQWAAEAPFHPRRDVYGATAILWWLVVGRPYRMSAGPMAHRPARASRAEVPADLDAVFELGLGVHPDGPVPEARDLSERLAHVFYAVMHADDERDGARAVARWVLQCLGPTSSDLIEADSLLAAESVMGRFTRALRQPSTPLDTPPERESRGEVGSVGARDASSPVQVDEAPTLLATGRAPEASSGVGLSTFGRASSAEDAAVLDDRTRPSPVSLDLDSGVDDTRRPDVSVRRGLPDDEPARAIRVDDPVAREREGTPPADPPAVGRPVSMSPWSPPRSFSAANASAPSADRLVEERGADTGGSNRTEGPRGSMSELAVYGASDGSEALPNPSGPLDAQLAEGVPASSPRSSPPGGRGEDDVEALEWLGDQEAYASSSLLLERLVQAAWFAAGFIFTALLLVVLGWW